MKKKELVHYAAPYLLNPTNAIIVNLIGAGGTGSNMISALARLNYTLVALDHPGLHLRLWDDDVVTPANIGRQLFAPCEVGLQKSVALINRVNRFFGTDWSAIPERYTHGLRGEAKKAATANITISCVDTPQARFEIADILKEQAGHNPYSADKPYYWMDCGNARYTGQVLLSTLDPIPQPSSRKYDPVDTLPRITDEYKAQLLAQKNNHQPSCSMAEALRKQSLYVNSTLTQLAGSLLEQLFTQGYTPYRGFFFNLKTFRVQPIPLCKTFVSQGTKGITATAQAA
ncbi:PRTRC system ThiF family protein [Olivibacter domesticus]|uniref:PRTRC system ThiF family protein n=1 Tax=Olivibacter domesticus TaxID=407022 RepID=A0A1H7ID41_OLID1|nr:PRTRC system ThiF family protein [Olivibacter domesticus]SEK60483.1 PRTRC system ThiF family protein [Olivibacter domesticus]